MRANKTDGAALVFRKRRGVILVYRTPNGRQQEYFSRARLGAALQRAEFIERVENTPVYLTYPHSNRLVRCVS